MKYIILIGLILSFNSFSQDDCLRYMSKEKDVDFIFKKQCQLILEDTGKIHINEFDGCFSKIRNKKNGIVSFALVADLETDRKNDKNLIIFNSANASEDHNNITLSILSMSPELSYQRNLTSAVFDKKNQTLHLKVDKGWFSLNNKYQVKVECSDNI